MDPDRQDLAIFQEGSMPHGLQAMACHMPIRLEGGHVHFAGHPLI